MMRTDPRKACGNEKELLFWAAVHDAIAHPLMVFTGYSRLSLRFHDWTSFRAWPREDKNCTELEVYSRKYGNLLVIVSPIKGLYQVRHPRMDHVFGVQAADAIGAVEQAEHWFDSLTEA